MFSIISDGGIAPPASLLRPEVRVLLLSLFKGLAYPYQLQTLPTHPSALPADDSCSSSTIQGRRHSVLLRLVRQQQTGEPQWVLVEPCLLSYSIESMQCTDSCSKGP